MEFMRRECQYLIFSFEHRSDSVTSLPNSHVIGNRGIIPQVFLVSGNDDGYVPTLGTRSWIGALKSLEVLPIKISSSPGSEDQIPGSEDQIPWINNQTGRVGGFVTRYRLKSKRGANFDLAVIMNAGHQPPYFQPAGVAQLVSAWVGRVVSGKVAKR